MSVSSESWQKITRGCAEIISEKELRAKLEKGKPLRIKLGVDPTAPDLHLGHLVVLKKLRDFQELGHQVEFIIGDFTALIGDPSGRSELRRALPSAFVNEYAQTYKDQVFKVLMPERTRVHFNSQWIGQLGVKGLLGLQERTSLSQMLQRADFAERFANQQPISLLELVYPVLQGYDSVETKADVELGGTDQKFNLLMGRELQEEAGYEPQVVMMMPLLEGIDGVRKMSKSYGNYVAFNDTPKNMFGKIMSIPDALMPKYAELLTDLNVDALKMLHPRQAKVKLAWELTAIFHGQETARQAATEFERVFSKKEAPEELFVYKVPMPFRLADVLVACNLVSSKKEVMRLVKQGAVEVNGKKWLDACIFLDPNTKPLIRIGKHRFVRIEPV
jgi:tyrosyl-tRNA synthetase